MFINIKQKLVVITPPRAGSTRLKKWFLGIEPRAHNYTDSTTDWIMPFRHGEYAMLKYVTPDGKAAQHYDGSLKYVLDTGSDPYWRVAYILRQPIDRLYSLWLYMQHITEETHPRAPADWRERNAADAQRPFEEWLLNSKLPFNEGGDADPREWGTNLYSRYCTALSVPAARKTAAQFLQGCPKDIVVPVRFTSNSDYIGVFGEVPPEGRVNAAPQETKFDVGVTRLTHARIKQHFTDDYKLMEIANERPEIQG